MLKFLALLLFTTSLFSEIKITKEWLDTKPRSFAKDFYIWRYLDSNITADEAIWALGEANRVNNKLFYRYANKLHHKETSRIVSCQKMSHKQLISQDATCIELGLTPYKATKLTQKELESIINIIKEPYENTAKILEIIKSPIPFQILIHSDNKIFYDTFLEVGGKFRAKYFNFHLPLKTIEQLKQDKKNFERLIRKIVIEPKLTKLQESLLHIQAKDLSHATTFFLAMNAIKHKNYKKANQYLQLSGKNAYFRFDIDKVKFWQYQLNTNNKTLLKDLANSWDVNIYSLWAKEQLGKKVTNVVYKFPNNTNSKSNYNIHDPFSWLKVLSHSKKMDIEKLAYYEKLFDTKELSGHLAFVQERFKKYKQAYYPSPYDDLIKNFTPQRQALINAIARQESRFIPTSISHSYALGVMQIMPFLSKAIAKELKEPYDIDKQLEARTNIRYSDHHLDYLENRLKHPLLIAYAYNGGIGFTKRMLQSGIFKKGKFEPYLSMELVPYDESKRYGKKVLANYVIYYNNLHKEKVSISTLLRNLNPPYQK